MKELNVMQMEEIVGGGTATGCMAAMVGDLGIIAVSAITGGLALFLAGLFFGGSMKGLMDCVNGY